MKVRKAISPVLATVILIAITLIAAIAVAGFIFGLFGNFTNSPQVSATANLSAISGDGITPGPWGTITLFNSGTGPANIQSVTMTYNGQTCDSLAFMPTSVLAGQSATINIRPGQFSPGSSNAYQCGQVSTPSVPTQGESYTGYVLIQGGYQILFTGTFH